MAKPTVVQLQRLVGNPDAYAVQNENSTYTPVREKLTASVLQAHLDETITVGTYIGHLQDGATIARTLVFDVDTGGVEALEQVSAIQRALSEELGVPASCMGIEFSGKKGYHLWLPLQEPRPNSELRRVGRAALALAKVSCEVYPKQDEVRDLGNLVKLPGGLHRVSGKQNDFLDRVPVPLPLLHWERVYGQLPEEQHARRAASESRFPCIASIQEEGVREGSRNIQLFHLAAMLRRAGVTDENVDIIVRKTNEMGDPLDEEELGNLLGSSRNGGPICSQLPEERRCGELCLMNRMKGLRILPQQLRNGIEGEPVVVTLSKRAEKNGVWSIELAHDDIKSAKAVLT